MRIRAAEIDDAPALGRVMVASWLAAHRGQMPDAAWQKRVDEWTPDVSAQGWVRVLTEQAESAGSRDVVLVAEDDSRAVSAVVHGTAEDDDPSGLTAEISALYVAPSCRRRGLGAALLKAAAAELAQHGFSSFRLDVLIRQPPCPTVLRSHGWTGDRPGDVRRRGLSASGHGLRLARPVRAIPALARPRGSCAPPSVRTSRPRAPRRGWCRATWRRVRPRAARAA